MSPEPPDAGAADLAPHSVSGNEGDVLFRAGDASRDLFVLIEGQLELLTSDGTPVATCTTGDVFGERSFFGGAPRDVTARATSAFRALRLDRDTFTKITIEDPSILWLTMHRLSTRRVASPTAAKAQAPGDGPKGATPPAPAAETRASLVISPGARQIQLPAKPEIWVGRRDTASNFMPEVDLTDIDTQRSLSRRHAQILRRDGRLFVVESPDARNGTFVNGQRLGKGREAELSDGDRLRFGLVETVFRVAAY